MLRAEIGTQGRERLPFWWVAVMPLLLGLGWACGTPATHPEGSSQTERSQAERTSPEVVGDGGSVTPESEPGDTGTPEANPVDQGTLQPDESTASLTWMRDVLPIVQKNCQSCHIAGGVGPFALDRYEDAKKRAALIKWSVETGRMPPWMPEEDNCQPFKGSRKLTAAEIQTIVSWVDQGAVEGDPADAPKQPPPSPGQPLPRVDRDLDIGTNYTPSMKGDKDDYHCFVVDPALTQARSLVGFRVIPGERRTVHHVLIHAVDRAAALQKEATSGKGWTCYGGPGVGQSQLLGGWVPGSDALIFPRGTGMRVEASEVLVLQIHYSFSALDPVEPIPSDRTRIQLQFEEQVALQARFSGLANRNFSIAPGVKEEVVTKVFQYPGNYTLWGVTPHMHQFGVRFRVEIERADGSKTCLIDIPRWDFNWQQTYFFDKAQGIPLNRGDKVRVTCVFSNPTQIPLRWGESTTEEMCLNYVFSTNRQ